VSSTKEAAPYVLPSKRLDTRIVEEDHSSRGLIVVAETLIAS